MENGGIKMSLQGKKVLVVGTGKSGIAATELLRANNIDTVLFDAVASVLVAVLNNNK